MGALRPCCRRFLEGLTAPSLIDAVVVVVAGANGSVGRELVSEVLGRGAAGVYATVRRPRQSADPRVVPLVNTAGVNPATANLLDIADPALLENVDVNFRATLSQPVEVLYPELLSVS